MARRTRSGSAGIITLVALLVLVAGGYLALHGARVAPTSPEPWRHPDPSP